MLSPQNSRPIASPYSPPISASPSHTSTLWATPSACSCVNAAVIPGVIHVPACSGRGSAHAAITAANAVSSVTRQLRRRRVLASERGTCSPSGSPITIRGAGQNHVSGSSTPLHGKMPRA
jgi:hypothetical protein